MEIYGGAERVTQEMAIAFPDAEVTALLARPSVAARMGIADRIRTVLPPRPAMYRHYRLLTPLFPFIADHASVPGADVVLSSSYGFAHRIGGASRAPRVCYCHSPLRFAWTMTQDYRQEWAPGETAGHAFRAFAAAMRLSDRRSAENVDVYLTQSPFTAQQIKRFYGQTAAVVGAPVDCEVFRPSARPPSDYFLICGRLIEPYKRVRVAIEAFRRLGRRLVVAGMGPAFEELRAAAPPNVEFLGHLDDADLVEVMQDCLAGIFPSRDDFGLTPIEVMACGRPVLAFGGGGARHVMRPGVTGELFAEQTPDAIVDAVSRFDPDAYHPHAIREHALHWDRRRFRVRLMEAVTSAARGSPSVGGGGGRP